MRIDSYNGFILESKLSLILEASMVYSDEFVSILSEIFTDENVEYDVKKIVIKILGYFNRNVDINTNYIDISDKPNMVRFIPDDKVSENELTYRIINTNNVYVLDDVDNLKELDIEIDTSNLKIVRKSEIINNSFSIINTYKKDNLTIIHLNDINSDNTYIVYGNGDIDNLLKTNIPSSKRVSDIKVGRFIKSFLDALGDNIPTKSIENFVEVYTSKIMLTQNALEYFSIVEGEEIKKWYLYKNYSSQNGQLGSSCMRYEKCQEYFDIYVDNPDVCKLLIYKDSNDKLLGRAVLWKLNDGRMFMDRVYTESDNMIRIFEKWGTNNGYLLYRTNNEKKYINIKPIEYDKYPYLDTFYVYRSDLGELSNDTKLRPVIVLQNTNGGFVEFN